MRKECENAAMDMTKQASIAKNLAETHIAFARSVSRVLAPFCLLDEGAEFTSRGEGGGDEEGSMDPFV